MSLKDWLIKKRKRDDHGYEEVSWVKLGGGEVGLSAVWQQCFESSKWINNSLEIPSF
jgi:hypothetical protein